MDSHTPPAIVVIEDDQTLLQLLEMFVITTAPRYPIYTCSSGTQALDYIARTPVCCVITDYLIADMDAFVLARAIHSSKPELPLVLLTGITTDTLYEQARAVGYTAIVSKPASTATLRAVLLSLLPTPTDRR